MEYTTLRHCMYANAPPMSCAINSLTPKERSLSMLIAPSLSNLNKYTTSTQQEITDKSAQLRSLVSISMT